MLPPDNSPIEERIEFSGTEIDLVPAIEAVLFAAGHELTVEEIRANLELHESATVESSIQKLVALYKKRGGALEIRKTSGGAYVLGVKEGLSQRVASFTQGDLLDAGELRTLALIAYKQPLSRKDLQKSRGIGTKHVKKLVDVGFIYIQSTDEGEIYTTTPHFADYFGVAPDPVDIRELLGAFVEDAPVGE